MLDLLLMYHRTTKMIKEFGFELDGIDFSGFLKSLQLSDNARLA